MKLTRQLAFRPSNWLCCTLDQTCIALQLNLSQQGMYFELMNSPTEARSLYQKELDKDPNNPLMLKRMVSGLGNLLACCLWQQAAGCREPRLLLAAGTCTTCSRLQGGDLLD